MFYISLQPSPDPGFLGFKLRVEKPAVIRIVLSVDPCQSWLENSRIDQIRKLLAANFPNQWSDRLHGMLKADSVQPTHTLTNIFYGNN